MKKTDKLLIGIVAGILLLVLVAFGVALTRPKPAYQAEDKPEGVAFNYLFALQQGDYERAYGYLSPTLKRYPQTVEKFRDQIHDYSWNFSGLDNSSTCRLKWAKILTEDSEGSIGSLKKSSAPALRAFNLSSR